MKCSDFIFAVVASASLGALLAIASPAVEAAEEADLVAYLDARFPGRIEEVVVGESEIVVRGRVAATRGALFLADLPMDLELHDPESRKHLVPIDQALGGSFLLRLPRYRERGGHPYDRLLSRWQIWEQRGDDDLQAISHARYADRIHCRAPELPAAKPRNKKGLGGWHLGPLPDELRDLGISSVTVNVLIHSLISLTAEEGGIPFQWQGRTYYARESALAGLDAVFRAAMAEEVMVSAILLVGNPAKDSNPVVQLLGHPEATEEGVYAMPNVTSPEGLALYGAILNLMAERWSRPDGKYGRVHHWILHNEVDAGVEWTNAGEKSALRYMDLYQRSMRLAHLITRQYDPHTRPFISLTHHWAKPGRSDWYGSKFMLETLLRFTSAEGDFPWALAYHPYPQDLFNPRTWEDDQATFSFDTAKITPHNLEVLDAFMKQSHFLEKGEVRPVHLSENGFNSRDYSAESLHDQAAGMAYAWHKIEALSSVEVWHYHNWIDHPDEGGLRLGLRKFRNDPEDPLGKKPIWYLYEALASEDESHLSRPYLKTVGHSSWRGILYRGKIR